MSTVTTLSELRNRITGYLANGGMFNSELMDHKLVRNLLMDCRTALDLEKLLAEARLGEAEWWREQSHEGAICSTQDCEQCRRVAELRALAGSSGKQSEVGNED